MAAERVKAAGQLAVSGLMAWVVYPQLDKLAQEVTGNKGAEVGRRGFSTIPHAISQGLQGEEDPVTGVAPNVLTPSMPLNTAWDMLNNHDWKGDTIVDRQNLLSPTNAGRAAVQEGEFAAKNMIPPYGTIASAATAKGGPGVAEKFAAGQLGVKLPSPGAMKYQENIAKINAANAKRRAKKPEGPAEELYDRLTR